MLLEIFKIWEAPSPSCVGSSHQSQPTTSTRSGVLFSIDPCNSSLVQLYHVTNYEEVSTLY